MLQVSAVAQVLVRSVGSGWEGCIQFIHRNEAGLEVQKIWWTCRSSADATSHRLRSLAMAATAKRTNATVRSPSA